MFKQYKLRNYKFILVMYVMILNVIGILLIGSAKPSVQSKQILGMIAEQKPFLRKGYTRSGILQDQVLPHHYQHRK